MKVPNSINHESAGSILTSLDLRHEADGRFYRMAAGNLKEEGLVDYFKSLAHYRHELRTEVEKLLKDMPGTPVTPSKNSRSFLEHNVSKWEEAVRTENISYLSDLTREAEKHTSDYYAVALDTENLPDAIRTLLEKQHERVLEYLRKVERMEAVPQKRSNKFD